MSMRKPIALITECRREPRVRSSLRILCSLSYSNTWYRNERMHSHSFGLGAKSATKIATILSLAFATAALRQRQRRLIGELTLPALIFALPPALHIAAHFPSKLTNVLPLHLLAASMTSSSPRRHLAHHFLPRPNPLSPPSGQPPRSFFVLISPAPLNSPPPSFYSSFF